MQIVQLGFLLLVLVFVAQSANTIQNVHIALAGDESRMTISWLTSQPTLQDYVFYGTSPGVYTMNATSSDQTSYDDNAGWNHNVVLTNLLPGTTYYYICGSPTWALSTEFNFTTRENTFKPTTIAIYGDLGIDNSADTITELKKRSAAGEYDLFVHIGDISYANDHPLKYERTWNKWFQEMEPIMSTIPYMGAVGNHESWCRNPICAVQTYNFTTYKQKFRFPGNESGSGTNMFYSFDYYNIHFVAVNTEGDYPGAPPFDPSPKAMEEMKQKYYLQENWLHEDLQKAVANRDNVPWIVFLGHRAIYTPTAQDDGVPTGYARNVQEFFEPFMKQYSVDLYLAGHVHSYARTYPVYNSTVTATSFTNPPSPVHIFAGGAGNREGFSVFPSEKPSWYLNGNDSAYGFGAITVNSKSSLTWNYYLSSTGELFDSFTITKNI